MTESEITEARRVFIESIQYDHIWIHEKAKLPNWVAKAGSWIHGQLPPENNAITLGNRVFFPVILKTKENDLANHDFGDMAWFIHELTHVWQYQHFGIGYLFDALFVQLKFGAKSYDYGGKSGLLEAFKTGKTLFDFNPEQQGDIARDFYLLSKQGEETSAWRPFIDQFQSGPE
jgi:type VI secretion system secreted protein VgrG